MIAERRTPTLELLNRLQEQSFVVGENRRDHVYQLRHVSDLDNVSVVHEGVQESGDYQRVFQVIALLQNAPPRSFDPLARYQTFHSSKAMWMRRLGGSPESAARIIPAAVLMRSSRSSELAMNSLKLFS